MKTWSWQSPRQHHTLEAHRVNLTVTACSLAHHLVCPRALPILLGKPFQHLSEPGQGSSGFSHSGTELSYTSAGVDAQHLQLPRSQDFALCFQTMLEVSSCSGVMCPLSSIYLAWDSYWSSVNHNKPFLLLSEWLWLSIVPAAGPVYLHLFLLHLDFSKYDHQKPVPSTAGAVVFMGGMNGNCCSVAFHGCTAPSPILSLLLHLRGLGKGKGSGSNQS